MHQSQASKSADALRWGKQDRFTAPPDWVIDDPICWLAEETSRQRLHLPQRRIGNLNLVIIPTCYHDKMPPWAISTAALHANHHRNAAGRNLFYQAIKGVGVPGNLSLEAVRLRHPLPAVLAQQPT